MWHQLPVALGDVVAHGVVVRLVATALAGLAEDDGVEVALAVEEIDEGIGLAGIAPFVGRVGIAEVGLVVVLLLISLVASEAVNSKATFPCR